MLETSDSPAFPEEMLFLPLSLPQLGDNLALDEALLELVNTAPNFGILRVWESRQHAVVLGRSNLWERETHSAVCAESNVGIFRRTSGGGSVVVGPGCLMYSVILPISPALQHLGITGTTCLLLERIAAALSQALGERGPAPGFTDTEACRRLSVQINGTSDLTLQPDVVGDTGNARTEATQLKFSGNSQRWLRNAILHHGTLLYDFPLELFPKYLQSPPREPEYRAGRTHSNFVCNLPLTRSQLVDALAAAWNAVPDDDFTPPADRTAELARMRYRQDAWNLER